MPTAQETVLEIDLNALEHNYRYLRSKTAKEVNFIAVVKAYGYGSDVVAISKKLIELGADYLAVAYTSEGIQLREAGIALPILVFHPQPVNFESIIAYRLEPSLYSGRVLTEFISVAEKHQQNEYPVHIKFNTGLNRLGFMEGETGKVGEHLLKTRAVKAVSLFSHLAASADWKEREYTLRQIHCFKRIAVAFNEKTEYLPWLHICNTSGIINYPEAHFDMVRAGIGLYGFGNDPGEDKKLKPIGTLKTIISQIQYVQEGESVGYNRAFIAEKPTKIAVLPLGYADGIGRMYGNNNGGVSIGDTIASIIGNICMDMLMVDITEIDCKEGDEVIVFGDAQNASLFAQTGNTISYELITRISPRIKRVIVGK